MNTAHFHLPEHHSSEHRGTSTMYGEPMQTSEGVTVIPVSAPAGRFRPARPLGVFAVADGTARWVPATDDTTIALLGISVGMVATVLSLAAVVRTPPWASLSRRTAS